MSGEKSVGSGIPNKHRREGRARVVKSILERVGNLVLWVLENLIFPGNLWYSEYSSTTQRVLLREYCYSRSTPPSAPVQVTLVNRRALILFVKLFEASL